MISNIQKTLKKHWFAYILMIPSIMLFVFYVWAPLSSNILLSFYTSIGYERNEFIFLDNYKEVLADPVFLAALLNTFKYLFWSIVIGFILPIILAILLNEIIHLKGFFRAIVYFPNVVPGLAAIILWLFLYEPSSAGIFNVMLDLIGQESSTWLNNQSLVIPLIVLTMTWKGAGATTLIYLAVLQSVDQTYYEVSRLEGASIFQRVRHVTIPHLLPTIRVLFILQIISVFQVFYEPLVMTDGGPNNASISLFQLIYRYAFRQGDAAKAAALGVIVALLLMIFTVLYLKISQRKEDAS